MDARRPTAMTLRPPQPVTAATNGVATTTRSLKRTISKCGLDAACSGSDLNEIAPKKLAPLHDRARSNGHLQHLQQQYQQQQTQYELALRQQLQFYQQHQQLAREQRDQPANGMYVDDGEPVLLPRHAAYDAHGGDDVDHEYSPVAPFGWDSTPNGAKNRYYESILESTNAFVSPSPQHILYAYTPTSGVASAASTVSLGSSSLYSPFATGSTSTNGFGSTHNNAAHVPHQALQDSEYLNAANLHAIMVNYLEEIFQFYDLAKTFTFAKVGQMVQSVPFAFRYIQGLVKNRLGISWHLVGSFVENIMCFISDEDIREADMKEFADFLRSIQDQLYETMPPGNIFLNLCEFFQTVLAKFKKFLIQRWLALRRIQFPCEFGKKSETLFLCMECHREHR